MVSAIDALHASTDSLTGFLAAEARLLFLDVARWTEAGMAGGSTRMFSASEQFTTSLGTREASRGVIRFNAACLARFRAAITG